MIRIVAAEEADIHRILEIEREAIAPPWSREAIFSEISRGDSFFAVARGEFGTGEFGIRNSEFRIIDTEAGIQRAELLDGCAGKHGTAILGFVILRRIGGDGELLQIAVDRIARRCGVADLLMTAALRYADDAGLDQVFLEVRGSNDAAISLYKKHGFKFVRLRKGYYRDPTEDAVVMVRTPTILYIH